MLIKANGKEYNIEFTFKVARNEKYKESLNLIVNMMTGLYGADGKIKGEPKSFLNSVVDNVADKPSACATFIYVGLTGNEEIKTFDDAWDLMLAYMEETKDKSFDDLYTDLLNQMGENGFFDWTGLNKTIARMTEATKDLTKTAKK